MIYESKISKQCLANSCDHFYDEVFDILYLKKIVNYQFPKRSSFKQIGDFIISYDNNNNPVACAVLNVSEISVDFWLNDDIIAMLPDFVVNVVKVG